MESRVTITSLARQLDVHPSTVSLALRNSPEISAAMRERIQELARRSRYLPNHIARSLRRRSTRTLGVLFPYATLPYYSTLLDALDAEADERGLHLEVHFHQWSLRQEASAMQTLFERRVDGLILMAAAKETARTLRDSLPPSANLPVAIIGDFPSGDLPSFVRGVVATDMVEGSRVLGQHLQDMGHRKLAILVGANASQARKLNKVQGLRAALDGRRTAELQIVSLPDDPQIREILSKVSERGFSAQNNFTINQCLAEKFLALSPRPTVAITTDESMAQVLMTTMSERGLRVPDDVSIACYDGTFLSAYGPVPLTCVAQPFEDIARRLIELVRLDHTGRTASSTAVQFLSPLLIQRASVARLQMDNPRRLTEGEASGRSSSIRGEPKHREKL